MNSRRFANSISLFFLAAALPAAGGGASWVVTPTQRAHWAWKAPRSSPPPRVRRKGWIRRPLDSWVLAGMEQHGWNPAPEATAEVLLRRLTFDLTGLPPTDEDRQLLRGFPGSGAYERLVDSLLARPEFGQHWARYWLDLARYADSNGYEFDEIRPDMWRYRDYVVESFNRDKRYDRFLTEQLAGDLLLPSTPETRLATGFNLLGPDMTDAANQTARRHNTLNDMTDTAGLVFMGLTVGCARCHDHKYEPISQRDYYRLQAFFAPVEFRKDLPVGSEAEQARFQLELREYQQRIAPLEQERTRIAGTVIANLRRHRLAVLPEDLRAAFEVDPAARTEEQKLLVERNLSRVEPPMNEVRAALDRPTRAEFDRVIKELATVKRPQPPAAVGLQEPPGRSRQVAVLGRGELTQPGERVGPGFPEILASAPGGRSVFGAADRLALANWLSDPSHPLTGRVLVNRVWQRLFGRGLVATTSDFGLRGESPSHPALLDHLAVRFTSEKGQAWSLKSLIREMVTSATYRQSSRAAAAVLVRDPENRWLARQSRRRLDAEAIRDSLLQVGGQLNRKTGGPGVFAPLPAELRVKPEQWPVHPDRREWDRRSLYLTVRRNQQHPDLEVFDAPDTNQSCARREQTTSAPQALALLNSPAAHRTAHGLAERIAGKPSDEGIRRLYLEVLGRSPRPHERGLGEQFLRDRVRDGADPKDVWTDYALALLNTHEFLHVD